MVSFPPNFHKNIIAGNSDLSKKFFLLLNVIPEDKITLDFMEFLQIFKRFSGETRLNLAFAAKMHDCQRKNAAKAQEILPFGISFQ